MRACWLALGLSVLLAAAVQAEPGLNDIPAQQPTAEKPAKAGKVNKKPKATKQAGKTSKKKSEKKSEDAASGEAKPAVPGEPVTTTVDKLPGALKTVHVCAMPKATVDLDSERYARSVVFFVSCTAMRGGLTPTAVYVARDAKATGARLVTFESLGPDGAVDKLDMLYSVTPAREAYTGTDDPLPNRQTRNDTPWFVGAWAPDDRPDVCAIAATWRLQGDKGELHLWEEAKECPKGEVPKYESKIDRKPPPLVGR